MFKIVVQSPDGHIRLGRIDEGQWIIFTEEVDAAEAGDKARLDLDDGTTITLEVED